MEERKGIVTQERDVGVVDSCRKIKGASKKGSKEVRGISSE